MSSTQNMNKRPETSLFSVRAGNQRETRSLCFRKTMRNKFTVFLLSLSAVSLPIPDIIHSVIPLSLSPSLQYYLEHQWFCTSSLYCHTYTFPLLANAYVCIFFFFRFNSIIGSNGLVLTTFATTNYIFFTLLFNKITQGFHKMWNITHKLGHLNYGAF